MRSETITRSRGMSRRRISKDFWKASKKKERGPSKMVIVCVVSECKSRKITGCNTVFHQFPSDYFLRAEWARIIDENGGSRHSRSRTGQSLVVCSDHFERACYRTSKLLKSDAIPSIFPRRPGQSPVGNGNILKI